MEINEKGISISSLSPKFQIRKGITVAEFESQLLIKLFLQAILLAVDEIQIDKVSDSTLTKITFLSNGVVQQHIISNSTQIREQVQNLKQKYPDNRIPFNLEEALNMFLRYCLAPTDFIIPLQLKTIKDYRISIEMHNLQSEKIHIKIAAAPTS